jgi:LPXTG-motif cell wall-anchored protein
MSAPRNRLRLAAGRLAAAIGAAALSAGAFALPAAAQTPEPVEVFVEDYSPIAIGDTPELFGVRIAFGDDFAAGEHTVAATVVIKAPDNTFTIGLPDGSGSDCPVDETHLVISCSQDEADAATFFQFRYAPAENAAPGFYDYTVVFGVDGETVALVDDAIEVLPADNEPDTDHPYLHGDVAFDGVEPGGTVEIRPEFLQAEALDPDTAAVVVSARGADYLPSGLVSPVAGYDNCVEEEGGGVACVVTGFEDLPDTAFTFTEAIGYAVDATAPGPVQICTCSYEVRTVDADELEAQFGHVSWDVGSENLFGLRTVTDPESEFHDAYRGAVGITTAANPFDLAVTDAKVKGHKGDEVAVTMPVRNRGPASAPGFFDAIGSYVLIGTLPKGLALVSIDSAEDENEWACLDDGNDMLADILPEVDPAASDFICFFRGLDAGESADFTFTVEITDPKSKDKGSLEVAAIQHDGYPGVADAKPKNDTAAITVNGGGSANLPATGSSMTPVLGAAAAVLTAGAVLSIMARRRTALDA